MNTSPARRTIVMMLAVTAILSGYASAGEDGRVPVELPVMMREHMMANMRDHLKALHEIQANLAAGHFDRAADVAEQRLGMSSMASHGAAHMAPFMPKEMREIGTAMHHAASRFVLVAGEPDTEGHLARSLAALAQVSERCVACHAAFRLK